MASLTQKRQWVVIQQSKGTEVVVSDLIGIIRELQQKIQIKTVVALLVHVWRSMVNYNRAIKCETDLSKLVLDSFFTGIS